MADDKGPKLRPPCDRKMFGEKVRHVGDRVAADVAESPEIAAEALDAIKVEYEVLAPVLLESILIPALVKSWRLATHESGAAVFVLCIGG